MVQAAYLIEGISDRTPILLSSPDSPRSKVSFKLSEMWCNDPEFHSIVEDAMKDKVQGYHDTKEAIFSIPNIRSPCCDGFSSSFFVRVRLDHGCVPQTLSSSAQQCNATRLVIIPKFCYKPLETQQRLFYECNFAQTVWQTAVQRLHIQIKDATLEE
ncbi:hypothetical protein Cgig2_006827 [Carnegiea gigantea]|uniref:Uncharacterized protein n=1 Tax=Carnegiea gigantea TaxID=171969 RepID=A0A9Q1JQA3_9CARY|nr:hypothetical protein Cgig2_006827 [Carnegiea gigantea]